MIIVNFYRTFTSSVLMLLPVLWEMAQVDILKKEMNNIFEISKLHYSKKADNLLPSKIAKWIKQHQKLIR